MADYFGIRRVHISEATLACLNDCYEVELGHGVERDNYLKDRDVVTYLIKQTEPMRSRRRYSSRPKIWPQNEEENPLNRTKKSFKIANSLSANHVGTGQMGNASLDEEVGVEWIPEMPFENVSLFFRLPFCNISVKLEIE